jgi:hypothetical protein
MTCPSIDNPASCEIFAVIYFLRADNLSTAEIQRKLCAIYGQNIMSEGNIRQWFRVFKNGRKNIHDEKPSDRPAICNE